ncbi:MAG: type II secretion system protein [Sedimentisphaeraceae bacterium JB056]
MARKDVKKGFTLIELLVVISIIAVLMSIMMPALSRVREQAKQVSCMSNVRSLGQAAMTYANDYNGRYPLSGSRDESGNLWSAYPYSPFWDARLISYLGAEGVDLYADWGDDPRYTGLKEDWSKHAGTIDFFICPSSMQLSKKTGTNNIDENHYPRSYKYNAYIGGRVVRPNANNAINVPESYKNSVSVGSVNDASRTILFTESQFVSKFNTVYGGQARGWFDIQPAHFVKFEGSINRADNTWNDWGHPRSYGKSDFAFADGHAESLDTQFTESYNLNPGPGFTDYPDPIDGLKFHPTLNW